MPHESLSNGSEQPARVEARLGGEGDGPRLLPFAIAAVFEGRRPAARPPFHEAGGEWTFFDARTLVEPVAAFTVGVRARERHPNVPFAWGDAVLIVADRAAGARFVAAFRAAFGGSSPSPDGRDHMPKPLSMRTAILGEDIHREDSGGFSAAAGDWTATKWFPAHDGRDGEVYFNYDLRGRRGEFREKDADYADDLATIFATALRDGPRPAREGR